VSPFAKQHYVSHTLGDHTSLAALVEKRFLNHGGGGQQYPSLTLRDADANTLEDLFDFDHSPSLNATIPPAPPSSPADEGCGGSPSGAFVGAPTRSVPGPTISLPRLPPRLSAPPPPPAPA